MQRRLLVLLGACAALAAACQLTSAGTQQTEIPLAGTATRTAPAATPTATVTITPTPTQFAPFYTTAMVDNLNLRNNPGLLSPALGELQKNQPVLVVNRAPGGQWFFVRTQNGNEGWVFGTLLKPDQALLAAPVLIPRGVQMVRGHIKDSQGNPIRGIGFSVTQGSGTKPKTDRALSDPYGDFYAYLPWDASGVWTVSNDSVACDSNVWAGPDCGTYREGYSGTVEPNPVTVTLPAPDVLQFLWR
jgi:uncharacterized protein YgiM (DUF1202 family)